MKIDTKYDLGDLVFYINRFNEKSWEPCGTCSEVGLVELNGREFTCPACYGRKGATRHGANKWQCLDDFYGVIRNVKANMFKARSSIEYMFSDSGSGTVYDEKDLFLSREEAEAECARRNEN